MQEKESMISVRYRYTNLSRGSLSGISGQSLVMPNSDPWSRLVYPYLTLMSDSYLSLVRKLVFGVSNQVRHKRVVQPQKIARGLKFWIYEEEGLYYLFSENKGADQLRGYREADLCLCFRICKKKAGFLMTRLIFFYLCSNLQG